MFLIGVGNNLIRLPVFQPNLVVQDLHDNSEEQVINFGGVTLIGKRALTTIAYNSFYPKKYDSSYCEFRDLLDPKEFVKKILDLKNNDNRVRIIITELDINGLYTIAGFNYQLEEGTFDIAYSISLTEYRKPELKATKYSYETSNYLQSTMANKNNYTKETKKVSNQYYIVRSGDTITSLARKFNTTALNIWEDNTDVIGKNPRNVQVGMNLFIRGAKE